MNITTIRQTISESVGYCLSYFSPSHAYHTVKKAIYWLALKQFYVGYKTLSSELAHERNESLKKTFNATPFFCTNKEGIAIEAVYIKAPQNRTGHLFIPCLNTTYQDHHPDHWKTFLNNGSDILLWNPTQIGPKAFANDLDSLLCTLRSQNKDQVIVLKTYCASSDPAIDALSRHADPFIHLIVDRGHGDVYSLAASFTALARTSLVQQVLKEFFDCQGIEKIKSIQGKMLFLTPQGVDQVMNWKTRNFTQELYHPSSQTQLIHLTTEDHWENWSLETYQKVMEFLASINVVHSSYEIKKEELPPSTRPSCFKTRHLPYLIKSWC